MTDLAALHLTLPPGLSERIRAHAAQWDCAPEAAAIYCLMARFPAPSIIEATADVAAVMRSRDAHAGPGKPSGEGDSPQVNSGAANGASEWAPWPPDRAEASAGDLA